MHTSFWTGFEKQAKPSPGGVLNYAVMRAEELAKKRARPGGVINYATMPKHLPSVKAPPPKALASTPEQILKERQKTVARGGLSHTDWQETVKR